MDKNTQSIQELFTQAGAEFLHPAETIKEKFSKIRAFVFDWDGVFNNAEKNESGSSNFNEADSMGTNLLRFSHYIQKQHLPVSAVISGERNQQSFFFTKRERFDNCYYKVGNKIIAFDHFCKQHTLQPEEICYFFDDVLDLSIAQVCGLRILVNRDAGLLFKKYVREHQLADYITASDGGHYAIREACEMLMGLNETFDKVMTQRIDYDIHYKNYLEKRNLVSTNFYTVIESAVTEDTSIQ